MKPIEAEPLDQLAQTLWLIPESRGDAELRDSKRQPFFTDITLKSAAGHSISTRCEDLSSSGVRLRNLPSAITAGSELKLTMHLPGAPRPISVNARIMWRRSELGGAVFFNLARGDFEILNKALHRHSVSLALLAERYLMRAPHEPRAFACAGIVRHFGADAAARATGVEFLAAAATRFPRSIDVHLALAKVAIDVGLASRAREALQKAKAINRADPRCASIENALRAGRTRWSGALRVAHAVGTLVARLVASKRAVASAALTVIALAATAAVSSARDRWEHIAFEGSPSTLPCTDVKLADDILSCAVPQEMFSALSPDARETRAHACLTAVAGKHVARVIVRAQEDGRVLFFDDGIKRLSPPAMPSARRDP